MTMYEFLMEARSIVLALVDLLERKINEDLKAQDEPPKFEVRTSKLRRLMKQWRREGSG